LFLISLGTAVIPGEMKNKGYAKFWGANKVYYGRCASGVWAMGSCRGVKQRKRMMEGCTGFHKERRRLSYWTIGILLRRIR